MSQCEMVRRCAQLIGNNIDLKAENFCNNAEICERREYTHCHVISSSDVMSAISKLKADKVNDKGLVYSNNFTHGTKLLFLYLSILYTSMVYHGFCPALCICANIIPLPKYSKVNLSVSYKYRGI